MPSARSKITIRPNDGQDAPWRAAAAREGISLNEWITRTLDGAVESVLGESRTITPRAEPEAPPAKAPLGFAPAPALPIPQAPEPLEIPKASETRTIEVARAHMKRHRRAIECPSRVFVNGVCPECGAWEP